MRMERAKEAKTEKNDESELKTMPSSNEREHEATHE